jgi:hypothetical protein
MSDNDKPVVGATEWNRRIRDSTDALLAEAGFQPDCSIRHGLAMMNFEAVTQHSGMVSEGYVLVPVKPTAAITKALKADFPLSTQGVRLIYSLIIKAAQEQQHE